MGDPRNVVESLRSDEQGGFSYETPEDLYSLTPRAIMIWGATEESSIVEIRCGEKVVYDGPTPLPALFFGTAKTFEELQAEWDKGDKAHWLDYGRLKAGEKFVMKTRGPIKAIALLGRAFILRK